MIMASGSQPRYHRIVLKLSGEALAGSNGFGIIPEQVDSICRQIAEVQEAGLQVALIIGGGNIFRGLGASRAGMDRNTADAMGMLATLINSLAIRDRLEVLGRPVRVMSAVRIDSFAEAFVPRRAVHHLEKGRVVIIAGGTGHPFFSTDTAAALYACELKAEVILKATKVDGVYTDDPEKNDGAEMLRELSYDEVIRGRLGVMDLTAVTLACENDIPIIVFNMRTAGNLGKAVMGEMIGTIVSG